MYVTLLCDTLVPKWHEIFKTCTYCVPIYSIPNLNFLHLTHNDK